MKPLVCAVVTFLAALPVLAKDVLPLKPGAAVPVQRCRFTLRLGSFSKVRFAFERLVKRGLPDLESHRRLAHSQPFSQERLGALQLVRGDHGFSPAAPSTRESGRETGAGAFADELALELAERAPNM